MTGDHGWALRRAIEAEARRLGFQLLGTASPDPPAHFDVFERWLRAGRHGEMGYLADGEARLRRADPRRILPGCRSILALGIRYPAVSGTFEDSSVTWNREGDRPGVQGRVAAYAWGDDYHDVLAARLGALVAFIEAQVGHPVPNRWYTDTGPLLERDLAQRAGLGWIGKNTCLIVPGGGSYFLLAEVLLNLDLEPDPPFEADRCGTCERCLQACPTACILPDRTIDSRLCISYLTIELKGPIPPGLRPQIGNWVFGCDVCQQVCPWNERLCRPGGEQLQIDPAFTPRPGVPRPDLIQELALTSQEFSRKFRGSPLKRAKRRGYLRNVAVALGNSANPLAVGALAKGLLEDHEPLVRGHAAWALGRIGGQAARQALAESARRESDAYVLTEIRAAIKM